MPDLTSASTLNWHIIGLGKAGRAFAWLLRERLPLASVSASVRSVAARETLPDEWKPTVSVGLRIPDSADVVLFAVADDALARVVSAIATQGGRGRIWLHCSGVTSVAALHDLPGVHGSLHPLQSLRGTRDDVAALQGAVFGIAGDEPALVVANELVHAAQGRALLVPDEARAAYHLAAVLAGNGVFALLHAGRQVATLAGLDADTLQSGLARLATQSAQNGMYEALSAVATGPVMRGDAGTVRRHREWLRHNAAELGPLYQALGRLLLELADERGIPATALTATAVAVEE
jgi:predicted short-subunit dehydrogenase-like oxidoreductase (DUF2520 family)